MLGRQICDLPYTISKSDTAAAKDVSSVSTEQQYQIFAKTFIEKPSALGGDEEKKDFSS